MDNTDIRYANKTKLRGKELVYGVDLNNNPTLEDIWNSTPAWGSPWVASDNAPTPTAAASLMVLQRGTSQELVAMRCGTITSIWT